VLNKTHKLPYMKKLFFFAALLIILRPAAIAQNLPDWVASGFPLSYNINNTIPGTVSNPIVLPTPYNSGNNTTPTVFNYTRTWYPLV